MPDPRTLLPALLAPLMATSAFATSVPVKPAVLVDRDVVYGSGGGVRLHLDLYRPAAPPAKKSPLAPIVVFIHGGGWEAGSKAEGAAWAERLAARGFVAASVDYRLAPAHRYPACLDDVRAAVGFLRRHAVGWGGDPARIGAWGASAGGHLALMLGFTRQVQAVVDFFGPTDLPAPDHIPFLKGTIARAFGTRPADLVQASPITHVRRDAPPTLIVHGKLDHVVPVSQSERLYAKMRAAGAPAELLLVDQAYHGFNAESRPTAEAIDARVATFFQRHLKGR